MNSSLNCGFHRRWIVSFGTSRIQERVNSSATPNARDGFIVWSATLRRAKVPYFRIYDLRSTYATRLSAGGVADEWVTQLLRQGHCEGLQEVLADEVADETPGAAEAESRRERVRGRFGTGRMIFRGFGTVLRQFSPGKRRMRTSTLPEIGVKSRIFKDGM